MWSIYRWSGGLGPHSLSLPFISSLSVFPRAKDVISESQWQWRCKAGGSQPIVGNPSAGPLSGFHL